MLRLFLAISLPAEYKRSLSRYQGNYNFSQVRWTKPENLHITVHFFGYLPEKKLSVVNEKLLEIFSACSPFSLRFQKVKVKANMMWAVFYSSKNFTNLARKFTARKQIPHITLARFPRRPDKIKLQPLKLPLLEVHACLLMSSILTPAGPIYKAIKRYHF